MSFDKIIYKWNWTSLLSWTTVLGTWIALNQIFHHDTKNTIYFNKIFSMFNKISSNISPKTREKLSPTARQLIIAFPCEKMIMIISAFCLAIIGNYKANLARLKYLHSANIKRKIALGQVTGEEESGEPLETWLVLIHICCLINSMPILDICCCLRSVIKLK